MIAATSSLVEAAGSTAAALSAVVGCVAVVVKVGGQIKRLLTVRLDQTDALIRRRCDTLEQQQAVLSADAAETKDLLIYHTGGNHGSAKMTERLLATETQIAVLTRLIESGVLK